MPALADLLDAGQLAALERLLDVLRQAEKLQFLAPARTQPRPAAVPAVVFLPPARSAPAG